MGDFPLDTRSQFVFYTQSEKRLGLKLGKDGVFEPRYSTVGVIGLYDPSHKGRKRACGRCKYRSYCSIRAIGMTCHGGKARSSRTCRPSPISRAGAPLGTTRKTPRPKPGRSFLLVAASG